MAAAEQLSACSNRETGQHILFVKKLEGPTPAAAGMSISAALHTEQKHQTVYSILLDCHPVHACTLCSTRMGNGDKMLQ